VLVTGGAGFLGSHLSERLLERGHRVICLDNFQTGYLSNVAHLQDNPLFSLVRHDVVETYDFRVDQIFNLASPASPPRDQIDPIHTLKTSVLGSIHGLDLARRHGARILQASTSEVYGDPSMHPQLEAYWGNVNSFGPRACYDEGKRAAETLFFDYHHSHGVDIRIARIFNTYGPRMSADDGRVVSNFIVQALRGEDITIYGAGTQTRSFCYVDDLVEAFLRLMDHPSAELGPINLGNPDEFTMLELAELVIEQTGSSSRIVHMPLPIDDPRQRRPDIGKARTLLDWEPKVALAEGLSRTITYFDRLLSNRLTTVREKVR
jgi:UDP-glucuronate decarboxylase